VLEKLCEDADSTAIPLQSSDETPSLLLYATANSQGKGMSGGIRDIWGERCRKVEGAGERGWNNTDGKSERKMQGCLGLWH